MFEIINKLSTVLLITLLAILSSSCKKDYILSEQQHILFQVDHSNSAWGKIHTGFFIDNEGNVVTYHNPSDWNFLDSNYFISAEKLNENIRHCELSGEKISDEDLKKYTNYIRNIASSKISARKNVANDAGITEFICYQYSESTGTYQGHLVKMEGDFNCENLNFYSKKVTNWLREVSIKIEAR